MWFDIGPRYSEKPRGPMIGGFNVVVFTPEDLALPRASPGERRRFLDRAVFTLASDYLGTAQDYERVLKTRNTVLRQISEGAIDRARTEDLLAVYDRETTGARTILDPWATRPSTCT